MDSAFYSAISAQVGSVKVYPGLAADNATAPFVVYQRTSTQRDVAIDGATGSALGSYRIDVYATSLKAAQQLAEAIVIGLNQYSASPINFVRIDNEFDASDLTGDPKLFRVIVEATVHFTLT